MKFTVPEKIVNSLIEIGTVSLEEKELYEYGIRQGILMVINVLTAILIGFVLGMAWQSIIFLLTYIPIRTCAGGYHASSQLTCYLLSIPFMFTALIGVKMLPWGGYLSFIALFCSAITIVLLAPVEDSNKPLDEIEKIVYRKKTRIVLAVLLTVAVLLWVLKLKQVSIVIIMALVVAAGMLILGAIKNNKKGRKHKTIDNIEV